MKTTSKKNTARSPLPLGLALMAKGVMENDMTELREALAAARRALNESVNGSPEDAHDCLAEFIRHYAEHGPFRESVERCLAIDPGNIDGDLHCAFATPALLAGMSIAWLMLRGEGDAR